MKNCILLLLMVNTAPAAYPQSVDWRRATSFPNINMSGLSSTQRNEVVYTLRNSNCPCGCGMKLAECLIDDPTCPRSPKLARDLIAKVRSRRPNWRFATEFPNISFRGLTSSQRAEAVRQLRAADCPCGCGMKIAECLIDDPTCPRSPGLARSIVQSIASRTRATQRPVRRGKLHVVVITDHFDKGIGRHCAADGMLVEGLLSENIAPNDIKFEPWNETLQKRLTASNVLKRIGRLSVSPSDAVLVYFSGHGGYSKQTGQYFNMPHSNPILRRTVRAAIKKHNPRLGVLVSDCCYGLTQPPPGTSPSSPNDKTRPLMHSLFFQESGFVDITSSERGQLSWCLPKDEGYGSLFTIAMTEQATRNMSNRLTWSQFHGYVRQATERSFAQRIRPIPPGRIASLPDGQRTQAPYAFSLGNSRPRVGIRGRSVRGGMQITEVVPGEPAAQAGLEAGDVIQAVDGRTVASFEQFSDEVDEAERRILFRVKDGTSGRVSNVTAKLNW